MLDVLKVSASVFVFFYCLGLIQYQKIKLAGELNVSGNDSGFLCFSVDITNLQLALPVNLINS